MALEMKVWVRTAATLAEVNGKQNKPWEKKNNHDEIQK